MKFQLLFILLLFGASPLLSQDVLESNPPSIHWSQINTKNFRIIFPNVFDEQGQRMANTLEHIHQVEAASLGTLPRKISVILQNQSSISNGFVSILPRRSEFYAMPAQDYNFIGTNDWLDILASHEYRHVVQYAHATRGFNRLVYYLFGATTLAGMSQAAAPSWFWEGDAVATETAFTRSGRGKIPNFGLAFKTNLLEGRAFNYHKQYLRSYKHFIPDHYVLGYHMVSYLRKRTNDPEIWGKVTARSWSVPFIPFAFSNALKNKTDLYVTGLYREMVKDLQTQWKSEIDARDLSNFQSVTLRKTEAYTDYLYPHVLNDGSVLTMKRGIGDIEQFVITGKEEQSVFTPGFVNDSGMISAGSNTVVWSEYGYDPRWLVKNYSLIKAYNLKTKKKYVVGGRKSRYGSAAISPDETKIVAIATDTDYKTRIDILSFPDGKVINSFPNPENHFYSMPRWSNDGRKLVVLKTSSTGKTIVVKDVSSGDERMIFPYSRENFGYPILYNDYLLFNSPVSGVDDIYAVNLNNDKRYQITTSKYGAYNPSVSLDGKLIYYNDQTRNGLDVVQIPFDTSTWISSTPQYQPQVYEQVLVEQEGRPGLFDTIPKNINPVKKYKKVSGIINPYTWGFFVNDEITQANIGITSEDILSTTRLEAGYNFDINERTSSWRALASYQGLFPIIDVSASISNRSSKEGLRNFYDTLEAPPSVVQQQVNFEWKEKNVEAGFRIPLVTTSSKYFGNLTFGNSVGLTQVTDFENSINDGGRIIPVTDTTSYFFREFVDNGSLVYNDFSLTANRLIKQSRRDINSQWGQSASLQYYSTPFGGDFNGAQFSFYGLLYFPGFAKHHSLWGYWGYQNTRVENVRENYIFRNGIPLPRGFSHSRFQEFYSMSVNYTLPVWYPDIAIGPLVNIQRLRANGFLDYGAGSSKISNDSRAYTSIGIEAKLDINILRFLPQFDIGVRYSYGISPSVSKFEFLIGTINL
jgi:hypothetical protein